jgi:hypothetical protein
MPAVRVVDEHLLSPVLVYSGSGGVFQNELKLVVQDGLVREQTDNELIIKGFTFNDDLTVSLAGGRSFGRYASGTTIPSTGKTPAEVIQMAITEPISPTISLTSMTQIEFNQTAIQNVLDFSHTINSLGATVQTAILRWRRGSIGDYAVLSEDLVSNGQYTHTMTDTNFNVSQFEYQYEVTDTLGATSSVSCVITPNPYVAPAITYTVTSPNLAAPETATKREKGNVLSNISGNIARRTQNIDLISYSIQVQIPGSSWADVETVMFGPNSGPITSYTHNDQALKVSTTISYRIKVVDAYTTTYSTVTNIQFLKLIFFGDASSTPTASSDIRALPSRIFSDAVSKQILNTGNTNRKFIFAIPSGSVTEVLDLDALNANITNNYILSQMQVDDAAGTSSSYNVYLMTNSIPYTNNHRHQVTRN